MAFVDGYVVAVPSKNKDAYLKMAQTMSAIFRELGATRIVECWGEDVPEGKVTDFRRAVQAKEDESIVFSWVEYPSKEVRDVAVKKMMEDPRMESMDSCFDGKRMIFGGFAPILDSAKS